MTSPTMIRLGRIRRLCFDEIAHRDRADALEAGLARLQLHVVGVREPQELSRGSTHLGITPRRRRFLHFSGVKGDRWSAERDV